MSSAGVFQQTRPSQKIAVLTLTGIALIVFGQNYFRYNSNASFSPSANLIYTGIVYITFAAFTPLILAAVNRFNYRESGKIKFVAVHVVFSILLCVAHAFCCSVILYLIDLVPTIIFERFFLKYFTGIVHIHLLVYWFVVLVVSPAHFPSTRKVKRQPVIAKKGFSANNRFIPFDDVLWIEAFDHYQKIHTPNGYEVIKETITSVESKVLEHGFIRIHRSYIVNASRIVRRVDYQSEVFVVLQNGIQLKISRTYLENFTNKAIQFVK
jgi:hypothetical protein